MKIALITRGFSKQGGVSRYVVELAERFAKVNDVHVFTIYHNYTIPKTIIHEKHVIRKPYLLHILSDIYYNVKVYERMREDFDIFHSQGTYSTKCDVLTMHSCHKAWIDYYKSWDFFRKLRGKLDPINHVVLSVEKKVIEKGNKKIIAVSEGVKKEILEYYNVPDEKVVVIPNGVDLEEFKPDARKREKIREKYGIENNEIVLMFSGYEFKRKGLEYIIRALPLVKGDVKLLVVGKDNPDYYKNLASKLGVSDRIIFAGFVPDISEYYAASDIFVFPTLYEPFGLVIIEALASGLPVIVSELAGATDVMNDGNEGFLLKNPTNSEEISEKISILVEDENLRRQMSRNARRTAEKYSWDEVARRTMEVYEEVANARS